MGQNYIKSIHLTTSVWNSALNLVVIADVLFLFDHLSHMYRRFSSDPLFNCDSFHENERARASESINKDIEKTTLGFDSVSLSSCHL